MSSSSIDDSALTAQIEKLLRSDTEVARLTKRVLRAQRRLRNQCSAEAWQAYLRLEEVVNERHTHVSRLLAVHRFDTDDRGGS